MYQELKVKHEQAKVAAKSQTDRIAWLRLAVFVAGIGLGWLILSTNYLLGGVFIIGVAVLFLWLVKKHAQGDQLVDFHERMEKVNHAEIQLINR